MSKYLELVEMLKTLNESQLHELFNDMGDISAVDRLSDCAYFYVENYEPPESDELSDEQDALEVDNARRNREARG